MKIVIMNSFSRPIRADRASAEAFTFAELLVVLAVLALFVLMLFPALANTQSDGRTFRCLNNQKQIIQAWRMYAEDNDDFLPPNDYPFTTPFVTNPNKNQLKSWVVGTMEQPIDAASPSILVAPQSLLSAYVTNVIAYKCPADEYINPNTRQLNSRSISMNSAVGTQWCGSTAGTGTAPVGSPVIGGWLPGTAYNSVQTTWLTYGKLSSIVRPSPANLFVIIDENPLSINDGAFEAAAAPYYLIDFPANYHGGGASISFADGHALTHKWLDPRTETLPFIAPGQGSEFDTSSPGNQDTVYLSSITSAAR